MTGCVSILDAVSLKVGQAQFRRPHRYLVSQATCVGGCLSYPGTSVVDWRDHTFDIGLAVVAQFAAVGREGKSGLQMATRTKLILFCLLMLLIQVWRTCSSPARPERSASVPVIHPSTKGLDRKALPGSSRAGLDMSRLSPDDVIREKEHQRFLSDESQVIAGSAACAEGDGECVELTAAHARLRDRAGELAGVADLTAAANALPPDVKAWWSGQVIRAAIGGLPVANGGAEAVVQKSYLVHGAAERAQQNLAGTLLFSQSCAGGSLASSAQEFARLAEEALRTPGVMNRLAITLAHFHRSTPIQRAAPPPDWARTGALAFAVPKSMLSACGADHVLTTDIGALTFTRLRAWAHSQNRDPSKTQPVVRDGGASVPVYDVQPDTMDRMPGELPTTSNADSDFMVARVRREQGAKLP